MAEQDDRSDRWLVVGAGPSGLSVALAMTRSGLPFDAVEAGSTVGGLWNWDNPGTAIYDSAHFISSASRSGWADLPMPAHYPTYPRWWQIRDYIQAWAAHHDLPRHYEFDRRIDAAAPVDTPHGEHWDVTFADGERRRYRGVIACPGFQRVPNLPTYPGEFAGIERHSQTFRRADEFRGKRVLIVGAGNSAVDIACDAAVAADRAVISTRRGYWFMPKMIGGVPFDCWAVNTASSQERVEQFLTVHTGDPAAVGFGAPDHPAMARHPILNDQALHHLAHGDLVHRPEIHRFDGAMVHFVDGSREEFDEIVYATGYRDRVPFIAEEHCRISAVDSENDLFLWMFHRRHPHLAVLGPANLAAGGYWGLAAAADMIVGHLLDETTDPATWNQFRRLVEAPEPDLSGGYEYRQKPGHLNYVNAAALDAYSVELIERFGFEPLAMPADFEPPELLDIDAWLDEPRPVTKPSDGSLATLPYDPRELIDG